MTESPVGYLDLKLAIVEHGCRKDIEDWALSDIRAKIKADSEKVDVFLRNGLVERHVLRTDCASVRMPVIRPLTGSFEPCDRDEEEPPTIHLSRVVGISRHGARVAFFVETPMTMASRRAIANRYGPLLLRLDLV